MLAATIRTAEDLLEFLLSLTPEQRKCAVEFPDLADDYALNTREVTTVRYGVPFYGKTDSIIIE